MAPFEIFKGGKTPEDDAAFLEETMRMGKEDIAHETKVEEVVKAQKEKTAGSLWGSSLAAVGAGGLGAGVLLGEALKLMMKADFDAHGITAANDDFGKMFEKGYNKAYGKKAA